MFSHQASKSRNRATQLRIESLEDRTVPSTFQVMNLADSGAGSLRAAVEAANTHEGADSIRFANSASHGAIKLTSGELTITDDLKIDGPNANFLAISGNDKSRIFHVESGATVSIDDVAITHGKGLYTGGGVWNQGTLTLNRVIASDNTVNGTPGLTPAAIGIDAFGGAVFNQGSLTVRQSLFVGNHSLGGDGVAGNPVGSVGLGGAIASQGEAGSPASTTIIQSTFSENEAIGGNAGPGSLITRGALGGAVMNGGAASTTVLQSVFTGNKAVGGVGGGFAGGYGAGGAIANIGIANGLVGDANLVVKGSLFTGNQAIGGAAPAGTAPQHGRGGAIANFVAPSSTSIVHGFTDIDSSTFIGNAAIGSVGPNGGLGQGGAFFVGWGGILNVKNSLLSLNQALGGEGVSGIGGNGEGGAIYVAGPTPPLPTGPTAIGAPTVEIESSIIALNKAQGGDGVADGLGLGGGVYVVPGGDASANDWTFIFWNDASTSDDDVFGLLD